MSEKKSYGSQNSRKYAEKALYTFPKTEREGCAMELPKNIVQIGKPDKLHKIFVEDYVISYMKQTGRAGGGDPVGLALYGRAFEEEACSYYFLYCAAKVEGIEHRGPYLSQVEKEEAAELGKRHFPELDFLAWCSVQEACADSIFVLKQGKGIEVGGYACFYEKNESMLNYMLTLAKQEKREESSDDAIPGTKTARGEWKAEACKKQMWERAAETREKQERGKKEEPGGKGYGRAVAAAALFALCLLGISTLSDPAKREELQVTAQQVVASLSEQKLADEPKEPEGTVPDSTASGETVQEVENRIVRAEPDPDTETAGAGGVPEDTAGSISSSMDGQTAAAGTESGGNSGEIAEQTETEAAQASAAPILYTIVKGDTLISICREKYGNPDRIQEICELNQISDPDSIAVGQTILLPR